MFKRSVKEKEPEREKRLRRRSQSGRKEIMRKQC